MSNEAPKTMWVFPKKDWFNAGASTHKIKAAGAKDVEYILKSEALALVAVERESISEICEDARKMLSRKQAEAFQSGNDVQGHRLHTAQCAVLDVEQAIRALTPADALAAREARDKQVRDEAIREAAEKLGNLHDGFTYRPRDMKRHVLQMIDRTAEND